MSKANAHGTEATDTRFQLGDITGGHQVRGDPGRLCLLPTLDSLHQTALIHRHNKTLLCGLSPPRRGDSLHFYRCDA